MRLAINPWVVFENPWHRFLTLWKIWAQNAARPPNLAPWTPDLNYRLVPRNYLSFRRVISIEKLSWATFPISAWVCDQLLAYTFVDMLSFRKFFCNCLTCKTLTVTVTRKSKQYLNVLATLCALFSKAFINFSLKNPPKNYVKLQHDICKKISKHIMCLTYYKQRNLCLSDMYHSSQQIL